METTDLVGLLIPVTYLAMLGVEARWPARQFPPRRGWRWLGLAFLVLILAVGATLPLLLPVEYPHFRHWRESMMAEFPAGYMRVTPDLVDRLCAAKRGPPHPLLPPLVEKIATDLSRYVN